MRRKLWPKAPTKEGALGEISKKFQVYFIHIIFFNKTDKKIYNRAKELYCDATIFVFWLFIVYLPKKKMETEKWLKAADFLLLKFWSTQTCGWEYTCHTSSINNGHDIRENVTATHIAVIHRNCWYLVCWRMFHARAVTEITGTRAAGNRASTMNWLFLYTEEYITPISLPTLLTSPHAHGYFP